MHLHTSNKPFRPTPDIRDELWAVIVMLPLAYTSIRSDIHHCISATDSTPSTGGRCDTTVDSTIARYLYDKAQKYGANVRLDDSWQFDLDAFEALGPRDREVDMLASSCNWERPITFDHARGSDHINLGEMRAVVFEVKLRCTQFHNRDSTIIMLNDSQVCVGALSKGRSS